MGSHIRVVALVLLAAALAACSGRSPAVAAAPEAPTLAAQVSAADIVTTTVVAVREAIEPALPAPLPERAEIDPRAVALIVQFEIRSPAFYTSRLLAPVWPGAQSGVTWGIGYDGGQQTRARIATDWREHGDVERLAATSGVVGYPARAAAAALSDVRTPYPYAERVFARSTLPAFADLTERTYRNGWDSLSPLAQGALIATVYNRGSSMVGDRRREMRVLRDQCVPQHDYACMAVQFRSMTRLWIGTAIETGMRARYEATARLVEQRTEA